MPKALLFLCVFCFLVSGALAEYSCDEDRCNDYKLGIGGFYGWHHTSMHDMDSKGVYLSTLVRRWTQKYGFNWNAKFGFLKTDVRKNATDSVIAYDEDRFSASGAYLDSYLSFGKNLNSLQNPVFLEAVVGGNFYIFNERYGLPQSNLLTIGVGISGIKMLSESLAFEYALHYGYGFYGFYTYSIEYGYNRKSVLNPNNHELRVSIGLHRNKVYGFYTKLNFIFQRLDSAASVLNRYNVSSSYPHSTWFNCMLEFGFGFNQWL